MVGELILFSGFVALVIVVGLGLGMLIAPRLGRMAGSDDEDDGGDDD